MSNFLRSINTTRQWIIIYGLIIFTSISFIYSNVTLFTLISNEGLEIPRLLFIIAKSWWWWIVVIALTTFTQTIYSIYLYAKERR